MVKKLIIFVCAFSALQAWGQTGRGSLWKTIRNYKEHDTVQLNALNRQARALMYTNPDSAYVLGDIQLRMARKKKRVQEEIRAANLLGHISAGMADYRSALQMYTRVYELSDKLHDHKLSSAALRNMGLMNEKLGNLDKALDYQQQSLAIAEEQGAKNDMALSLHSISGIYLAMNNDSTALKYEQRCLQIATGAGDSTEMAATYNNIGNIYLKTGNTKAALEYHFKSLGMKNRIGDKSSIAVSLGNLSRVYVALKQYPQAKKYLEQALALAVQTGNTELEEQLQYKFYQLYKRMNNKAAALDHYERYTRLRDSQAEINIQREIARVERRYNYDNKVTAANMRRAEEKRVQAEQARAQQAVVAADDTERFALYFILGVTFLFFVIIYNRVRVTSRQRRTIARKVRDMGLQKKVIDEKQREITEAMNYAQRMQLSVMAHPEDILKYVPESFILHKPKSTVAGDFYYFEATETHLFFAAADCARHGVPGALVSVLFSNALSRCIRELHLTDPGKILDKTREIVLEAYKKTGRDVKDVMGISLLVIPIEELPAAKEKSKRSISVQWAGAHNPLWYLENGVMHEVKASDQSIGYNEKQKHFASHSLSVKPGTTLFLFTDGYALQPGGPNGDIFDHKQLSEFLVMNAYHPMPRQKDILDEVFTSWSNWPEKDGTSRKVDQTDDICVIGIRL